MPNIQEFDAGNLSLRPTEVGVEAAAGTARRVGMFSDQRAGAEEMLARETERLAGETSRLGSETATLGAEKGAALADTGRRVGSSIADAGDVAVKYLDHQQISQGAPAFALLMDQKTQEWNDTVKNADPNDPTVARKFLDNLEPDLTKFKEQGFYTEAGQNWAEAHVDALRQHLTETTQADMANKAKQATDVNLQQMSNSLSSNVYNDPSKSNLDFSLAAMRSGLEGMLSSHPDLNAAQVGQARTELLQKNTEALIKSSAIGYVAKTGQLPPWINDPKYAPYINGAELKMFEKAAQVQDKANQWTQKQLETAQRKDIEVQSAAELSKNWTDNVKYDATGQVHVDPKAMQNVIDIETKYPGANTADSQHMISFLRATQREQREVINSDQTVRGDLLQRFSSPDKVPTEQEILRAEVLHQLSPQDSREMLALQKAITQRPGGEALKRDHAEFFKQYGPTIDPEMKLGNPTPLGAQAMYRAEMDAYRQEEALRQRNIDPHELYQPNSPNFLGKNISSYRPSLADQAAYNSQLKTDRNRPAASVNLTANGSVVTGIQTLEIPDGMSPADAMKWAREKGAKQVKLPDGRIGTVQ
jgi:hypothetical protein